MTKEKSSAQIMLEQHEEEMKARTNIVIARILHNKINAMRTLGDFDNTRIELELKIMQHYFAYSDFTISFKAWLKIYLNDILGE